MAVVPVTSQVSPAPQPQPQPSAPAAPPPPPVPVAPPPQPSAPAPSDPLAGIGLSTGPLEARPDVQAQGIDAMPSDLADRAAADWETNPMQELGRAFGRYFAATGVDPSTGIPVMAPETPMAADEANAQYGIPGELKFDNPVAPDVAKSLYQAKRDELARQDIYRRQPAGIGNDVLGTATDFAVSSLDPLNVAASFIPVVGEARYAGWLASAGDSFLARAGVRAAVGAAQGVAGTAPIVALHYGLSRQEQQDYSATDALLNLAYGGLLGAGLHAGAGIVGDLVGGMPKAPMTEPMSPDAAAIDAAPVAIKEAALRTAIAQVSEGRPVEVLPIFDLQDMSLLSREAELRQHAAALDDFLGNIDVDPNAQAATDTLARLDAVNSQLADETISVEQRRSLMRRRDELLSDTNPNTLAEQASGLQLQRQAQNERASIGAMLSDVEQQRAARASSVALSPLPKLQDNPRFAVALRYAAGEPLPQDAVVSAMADQAAAHPAPINGDISHLEAAVAQAQQSGDLPAAIPELDQANQGVARAEALRRGFAQAAICLLKGGA